MEFFLEKSFYGEALPDISITGIHYLELLINVKSLYLTGFGPYVITFKNIITLRPEQKGWHFADKIFKNILMKEYLIFSLKYHCLIFTWKSY